MKYFFILIIVLLFTSCLCFMSIPSISKFYCSKVNAEIDVHEGYKENKYVINKTDTVIIKNNGQDSYMYYGNLGLHLKKGSDTIYVDDYIDAFADAYKEKKQTSDINTF